MIRKRKEERGPRPRVRVRPPGRVEYNGAGRHNSGRVTLGKLESRDLSVPSMVIRV